MSVSPGSRIARIEAYIREVKSPKTFKDILANVGLLAALAKNNRVKVVGGDEFHERVVLGESSNFDHIGKNSPVAIDFQDVVQTAKYAQAICAGSVIVNEIEEDQNASGSQRIGSDSMLDDQLEIAEITMENKIGEALMVASSAALGPTSIPETLPATVPASQSTPATGGLSRSTYSKWRTQHETPSTAVDLTAAAGMAALGKFYWACSPGGSGLKEQPDLGITSTGVFARFSGGSDVNRRYSVDDKMLKLGFDNIKFLNASIIADKSVDSAAATGILYFLNTNYMHMQLLASKNMKNIGYVKVIGDGAVDLPIVVSPAVYSQQYFNYVIKMRLVYNVTFGGLTQQGHLDNITQ